MDFIRADVALVSRGLANSRERAQSLIRAGLVRLNGAALEKPSAKGRAKAIFYRSPVRIAHTSAAAD